MGLEMLRSALRQSAWLAVGFGYPVVECFWLKVERVSVAVPIPEALSGIRIGVISDVHIGNMVGRRQLLRACEVLRRLEPDVLLFVGDFVHRGRADKDMIADGAGLLTTVPSPLGRCAVLGNHDLDNLYTDYIVGSLEDAGFGVLRNQNARVVKNGSALFVAGLDDAIRGQPDMGRAVHGIPEGSPVVVAVHEPDYALAVPLRPAGVRPLLQVSGHSHGGQMRIPLLWRAALPDLAKRYPVGLNRVEGSGMLVYTTRGLGVDGPPARLFCRPEVSLLTLTASEA